MRVDCGWQLVLDEDFEEEIGDSRGIRFCHHACENEWYT